MKVKVKVENQGTQSFSPLESVHNLRNVILTEMRVDIWTVDISDTEPEPEFEIYEFTILILLSHWVIN